MLRGLLLLATLLWGFSSISAATPQSGDYLFYQGDTLYLSTILPLEPGPQSDALAADFAARTSVSNCQRGYFSVWELSNDSLFWRGATTCSNYDTFWETDQRVFAYWIDAGLQHFFGNYSNIPAAMLMGWREYEQAFQIQQGQLLAICFFTYSTEYRSPFPGGTDSLRRRY